MHNAVMCTLSLYDVIGITRHLYIKLKSFSNIAQPLHKEAVRHCSFSLIIAKKSVIMSEAFLFDVSIKIVIFTLNLQYTPTVSEDRVYLSKLYRPIYVRKSRFTALLTRCV